MFNLKNHLPIDLNKFGFVTREQINGKTVGNRCGRDFFYYVLNYYFPSEFNPTSCNPQEIERREMFGIPTPGLFVWTCLPFFKIPRLLKTKRLSLEVNNRIISSFWSFLKAMIAPLKMTADEAIRVVEKMVDDDCATGIDISLRLRGLVDHVMFVYGHDEKNLYIFDTHKVKGLEYEKVASEENQHIMKLPKDVIRKHWFGFNRVWVVKKL